MTEKQQGLFITFEGGEGAGKSSQIAKLVEYFKAMNIEVISTCEPQKGGKVRELLVAGKGKFSPIEEANMMFEDRQDHVQNKVLPSLSAGKIVISDRFADSSRALQGYGMGVEQSYIEDLYKKHVGDVKPDLTIILDIDPAIGLNRSFKRNDTLAVKEDKYEKLGLEFHTRVREGFLKIAQNDKSRCVVINALGTVDEVHQKIVEAVENKFPQIIKKNLNSAISKPRI